ncbi:MAG TPA: transcriptional regulator GcvA [Dongiaceae bacterium]|jgi:LysR family glycine cleavage system transcriptional activator
MSRLPPLSAIRAFEAAARHGSFTKAAEELGMTQAAVSYQVKLLEDRVGMALFLRQPRKVVLSEAGQRLAPAIAEAFQRLNAAFASLRETDEGVLSVSCINTFCTNWLVPRLGTFQVAHPNIAVRLEASSHLVDFAREDFDVSIRGGKGGWPGLKAHLLFPVDMTAVASPEFLKRIGGVRTAEDLFKLPLLDYADECWIGWFAAAGVKEVPPLKGPVVRMPTQQMQGSAAIAGQGIALVTPELFQSDLDAGRLVQVLPAVCSHKDSSYWLVYPEERQKAAKIKAFRDWILAEIAADRAAKERTRPRLAVM